MYSHCRMEGDGGSFVYGDEVDGSGPIVVEWATAVVSHSLLCSQDYYSLRSVFTVSLRDVLPSGVIRTQRMPKDSAVEQLASESSRNRHSDGLRP